MSLIANNMRILHYKTPYLSSKCYLIEENNHSIIIDPCSVPELEQQIEEHGWTVDHVLLTHEHVDHIMGVEWCQQRFGPIVTCSKICAERIENPKKNHSYYFELSKSLMTGLDQDQNVVVVPFGVHADSSFEGEGTIQWQGHEILIHPTPGHSPGSVCILLDNKYLFSGDTLMDVDKSVTSFLGGSMRDMETLTLPWLRSLDRDIWVYPGHYQEFSLGERLDKGIF